MSFKPIPNRFGGYCECGDHAWANLTHGWIVLVSPSDAALIKDHAWCVTKDHWMRYARRQIGRRPVSMHRIIMGFPKMSVDHANGWGCDNRRSNLRLATPSQNTFNRQNSNQTGVRCPRGRRKWNAVITKEGKTIFIGAFDTKDEAIAARNLKACELFGEFVPQRVFAREHVIDEVA